MSDQKKKVVWLPYDMDTAIGINNEGALVFGYSLEDTDHLDSGADIYNGQQSVFWNNLRDAFGDELKAMYQQLRSTGAWSYDKVEQTFEEHQKKWGEAIFNEDAYFKYLEPLFEEGTASYLSMLQGSKEEQRKWWLYNRFRYLDSKYNAGDALTDVIQLRGYAKANITVTPYADIYAAVKYGSLLTQKRAQRNKSYEMVCPLDNVNDTEIYVYSCSQLSSVGDLSGLLVGFADFSKATRLQEIKLGDSKSTYANGNLNELYLGNNILLKTLDVRNCTALGTGDMKSVDVSHCTNIEELYFDGTAITGINLPNGGVLRVLHLPATITNLTIRNQTALKDFVMPSYANITTLWLENVSSAIDEKAILKAIPESSRVRMIGFTWEASGPDEITSLFDTLDKMRGLDEYGNNMDKAQVSGVIHTDSLTGSQIATYNERYQYVTVKADHTTSYLYYYNYDGSQLLYTETIKDGGDGGSYTGQPSRASTAQNTYTFIGWSKTPNSTSVDSDFAKAVTADRKVYAAYKITGQVYTVSFSVNGSTVQTVRNVPYGGTATYTGDTPVKTGVDNPDDWKFSGWSPSNTNITGNTTCVAQFAYIGITDTITDTWEQIIASTKDGTYKTKYKVGDTKKIDLGSEGIVAMQIVGFDKDPLADGSGNAPISFISEQVLATSHRWNPSLVTYYNPDENVQAWVADTSVTNGYKSNGADSSTATANWTITATDAGTVTVSYKYGTEQNYDKFTLKVNDATVLNAVSGSQTDWKDYTVQCAAGDTVKVMATYSKDSSGGSNGDTCYVKFSGTGAISITGGNDTYVKKGSVKDYQDATGSIGGWEHSEIRSYLRTSVKPLIPETVRNAIKTVNKYSYIYKTDGNSQNNVVTQDDVWIPSRREMFNSSESQGPTYTDFFTNNNSRIKKKAGESSASWWWLRSADSQAYADAVGRDGSGISGTASSSGGVALGFCI